MYFLYAKLILCILYILDENTIVTHQLQVPLKTINMFCIGSTLIVSSLHIFFVLILKILNI